MKKLLAVLCALTLVIGCAQTNSYAAGKKLVAITFDDGPSKYTMTLLKGLKKRGAKATFFCNGVNGSNGTKNHKKELKKMKADGHEIGNHTYSHRVPFRKLSAKKMKKEVAKVEKDIQSVMGKNYKPIVRIPGGDNNKTIRKNVNRPMITWSVDTMDWKYRSVKHVYNAIVKNAKDGDIILCHDLYKTSVNGALKAIDTLQKKGFEFVTVSELYRRKGYSLKNHKVYNGLRGKKKKTSA